MEPATRPLSHRLVEAQLRARGLSVDAAEATRVQPGLASLLGRLAQFVELVPREVAPPPTGPGA